MNSTRTRVRFILRYCLIFRNHKSKQITTLLSEFISFLIGEVHLRKKAPADYPLQNSSSCFKLCASVTMNKKPEST